MSQSAHDTTHIDRFFREHEAELKKFSDSLVEPLFRDVRAVYIDLACLKDTRMGLMASLDDGLHVPYLSQGLERYNLRPNRSFTIAYPEFPYSEDQLLARYKDPVWGEAIFNHAPDTDMSYHFSTMVNQWLHQNDAAQWKTPPIININSYPLQETPLLRQYLSLLRAIYGDTVTFRLFSQDPSTVPAEFWVAQSVLILDDVAALCEDQSNPFCEAMFKDRLMESARIYAAYTLGQPQLLEFQEKGLDLFDRDVQHDIFRPTALYFSLCCDLNFVPFTIPVEVKDGQS